MDLREELLGIIDAFEAAGIDYALCGGLALAIHGHPRFTRDIDVLIRPEDEERTAATVAAAGFDIDSGRIPLGVAGPGRFELRRVVKALGPDALSLDLLLVCPALEEVWASRGLVEWEGRRLRVVSRAGLVTMKRLAGRDQDLVDLGRLDEQGDSDG